MNDIVISGRLTRDPELRHTQSGKAVCNINVAVKRPFTKDETDFIDVVLWEQRAEFVSKYFSKGSFIIIRGSLQSRDYEDKEGNKRRAWEIKADDAEFGGGKNDNDNSGYDDAEEEPKPKTKKSGKTAAKKEAPAESSGDGEEDEDLPF